MDETYSKDFLESLYQMMDDIDAGKVKTYPYPWEGDAQKYYDD